MSYLSFLRQCQVEFQTCRASACPMIATKENHNACRLDKSGALQSTSDAVVLKSGFSRKSACTCNRSLLQLQGASQSSSSNDFPVAFRFPFLPLLHAQKRSCQTRLLALPRQARHCDQFSPSLFWCASNLLCLCSSRINEWNALEAVFKSESLLAHTAVRPALDMQF